MIIFKDIISDAEIMSDSYEMKEIDGIIYEIDCQMVTLRAVQVNTGANAFADEAKEATDDGTIQVNNIVEKFRLQPTQFARKNYHVHLKQYVRRIKEHLQSNGASVEKIKKFESGANKFAGRVLVNFDKYDFLVGEFDINCEGMVVLMNWREDGVTPFVTIWKDGLSQWKDGVSELKAENNSVDLEEDEDEDSIEELQEQIVALMIRWRNGKIVDREVLILDRLEARLKQLEQRRRLG